MEYMYLLRLPAFLGKFPVDPLVNHLHFHHMNEKFWQNEFIGGRGGDLVHIKAIAASRDNVLGPFRSKYD